MNTERIQSDMRRVLEDSHQPMKKPCRINCKLSGNDTLSLEDALLSFNGPIPQEQAWAVCHQTTKSLSQLPVNKLQGLTSLNQILLHKEGHILLDLPKDSQVACSSEKEAVFSLGVLIFKALDFRLDQKEERRLSLELKDLINLMTNCDEEYEPEERHHETDDEGIGRDSEAEMDEPHDNDSYTGNSDYCTLENIIQVCTRHIQGSEEQADHHYRTVIRAFVHEALELSQFLEKVAGERLLPHSKHLLRSPSSKCTAVSAQHLDTIGFDDWARFWVQVIGELRRGIKLKKVEENLGKCGRPHGKSRGAEFELTPYEILMNDIRERRYHLRKTPAPAPHVATDARDVFLEFIRSRPPLKKASERQLAPQRKQATMHELLMESIKKPPRPLRSCRERQFQDKNKANVPVGSSAEHGNHSTTTQPKKVIPVDFVLKLDVEEDDDDDDDDDDDEYTVTRFEDEEESSAGETYSQLKWFGANKRQTEMEDEEDKGSANPWRKTGGLRLTRNEYHRFCDAQLESYDLATQCPSRRASARKHTGRASITPFMGFTGTSSVPHSRPQSRQHAGVMGSDMRVSLSPSPNASPNFSPRPRERTLMKSHTTVEADLEQGSLQNNVDRKPSLEDMFLDERLSLTLEEIVHIRSVLTKAELESLPVEGRVKEDVEKRRVCFLCLKTRFGLLGPWGQRCRLCDRTVCVKCYSKMRIPTEHFAHVPVVLLSPGLLLSPSNSEPDNARNPWPRPGGAVGSAPASPAHRRRDPALSGATPLSTPNPGTPADNITPGSTPTSLGRRDDLLSDKRYPKVGGSPSRMTSSAIGYLGTGTEQRVGSARLRGVSMVVCHDCRIMVIQIIKSSRSTRATIRNNAISRLTLNLSPAYV